jgi:hypothetical protein
MVPEVPLPGGCNCGAVRYLITRPLLAAYICHCHLCQKRSGSAFSMSVVIPADGFQIVQGTPVQAGRILPTGGRNVAHYCPICFSRVHTQWDGRPTMTVRAGTLDETSGIRPVAQFWTSSAQPWALVRSNILSYAEQPTDATPMFEVWKALMAQG